ncbi:MULTISPECIES: hypothetical protein [unclassified Bradyrhizobium]|uniref:hypothetical protein n=1 Tax=unclassified Bradyrhizobium TaxID=2631580 RepID=UPI0028F0F178|nr:MULTISPECIES: hypothetical protein [unclassified Bradyrhizobium]
MSKTMVTVACLGVLSSRPSSFAQAPSTAGADTAPVECTIKDAVEDAACRTRLKGLFARKIDESDPPKLEFRYKAKQNENGRWRGGTPMTG